MGALIDSANGDFHLDDYCVGFMRQQIRVPMLRYLRGVYLHVSEHSQHFCTG